MSHATYTRPVDYLTYEGAGVVLRACLAEAGMLNAQVSVAVVDAGGHLLAFARTDGAEVQSIRLAENKARNAAFGDVPATTASGLQHFDPAQGGIPLTTDGRMVGAVAVSGAAQADSWIAEVGAAAILPVGH